MLSSLPKRRKAEKLAVRKAPQIRNASHLKWIRGHCCTVNTIDCLGRIEAAHVRGGTDGALGVKPSDCWTLPLCSYHHAMQHQHGEQHFQARHMIDMRKIAEALWKASPHRHKSEQQS